MASGYGGFVHVFEIVAAQQREAVPQEGFPAVAVVGGRKLTADIVAVTLRGLAVFGDLHHLVEPAVGEGLFALFDHPARRVVFVPRDLAVGILAADQLVRLVVGVGRGSACDGLRQDVARRIVYAGWRGFPLPDC